MSGLKSGSGDDLWDENGDDGDEGQSGETGDPEAEVPDDGAPADDRAGSAGDGSPETDEGSDPGSGDGVDDRGGPDGQPYIVRRAIRDKSVQFERDERLTFFVHRDVVDGERELVNDVESALGRDVPKFDVREAVYRAALRNREAVLDELLAMGYTVEDGE